MEWKNKFNSFNSWKGLLYSEWYKRIVQWKNADCGLLPPIEVSLDPIHSCNIRCDHCNAIRYLKNQKMDSDHLEHLISWLAAWGVRAICFGGGGEPTLHSGLSSSIIKTHNLKMKSSVVTNGILFTESLINAMTLCRWVGISVDAATPETYRKGKNSNQWARVIKNIERLVKKIKKTQSGCDVSFKFLIFDYNQEEILKACKLAKELGVKDFHARPADFRHQGMGMFKKADNFYDMNVINHQFFECHLLENKDFRVFTVTHKFNEDFTPKRSFSQCYASPICIQLCADGGIYLCPDTRQMPFYKLGNHTDPEEIARVWGGKKHYELVFKEGCKNCSSRCTFAPYNEQMERLFINKDDPMVKEFV